MFEFINNNIELLFKNELFLNIIKCVLIYYIIFVSFKLNNELVVLSDNSIIKMLLITMIFYAATYDSQVAVLIMLCLVFSLNTLNKTKLNDLLNISEDSENLDYLNMLSDDSIIEDTDIEDTDIEDTDIEDTDN